MYTHAIWLSQTTQTAILAKDRTAAAILYSTSDASVSLYPTLETRRHCKISRLRVAIQMITRVAAAYLAPRKANHTPRLSELGLGDGALRWIVMANVGWEIDAKSKSSGRIGVDGLFNMYKLLAHNNPVVNQWIILKNAKSKRIACLPSHSELHFPSPYPYLKRPASFSAPSNSYYTSQQTGQTSEGSISGSEGSTPGGAHRSKYARKRGKAKWKGKVDRLSRIWTRGCCLQMGKI